MINSVKSDRKKEFHQVPSGFGSSVIFHGRLWRIRNCQVPLKQAFYVITCLRRGPCLGGPGPHSGLDGKAWRSFRERGGWQGITACYGQGCKTLPPGKRKGLSVSWPNWREVNQRSTAVDVLRWSISAFPSKQFVKISQGIHSKNTALVLKWNFQSLTPRKLFAGWFLSPMMMLLLSQTP